MSIFLMAFTMSLEGQVTYPWLPSPSAPSKHSLLSTVYVVQNIVNGAHLPIHSGDEADGGC